MGDSDTAFCSRCGNVNHDVYDGVLDCGHSLDDGASLVDADELRLIEQGAGGMTLSRSRTLAWCPRLNAPATFCHDDGCTHHMIETESPR